MATEYTESELFNMSDEELQAATDAVRNEVEVEEPVAESTIENEIEEETEEIIDDEPELESELDDGEEEVIEEQSEDTTDKVIEDVTDAVDEVVVKAPTKLKYKANGQEFEFTEQEVLDNFGKTFAQSMNFTKKMQAIAPYRKMISAFEDEKLTEDDMNLMIDAFKGNKEAIASIVRRANIDAVELEDIASDDEYVPNSYGRNEQELKVHEAIEEISNDAEFSTTQRVLSTDWDDESRNMFVDRPELIKELHIDVVNGTFDKVSPLATKMKVLDGGRRSDFDYYVEAGRQYHAQIKANKLAEFNANQKIAEEAELARVAKAQEQRQIIKDAAVKRTNAAPSRANGGRKKVTDYLNDSDEAYEAWYKNLQNQ